MIIVHWKFVAVNVPIVYTTLTTSHRLQLQEAGERKSWNILLWWL